MRRTREVFLVLDSEGISGRNEEITGALTAAARQAAAPHSAKSFVRIREIQRAAMAGAGDESRRNGVAEEQEARRFAPLGHGVDAAGIVTLSTRFRARTARQLIGDCAKL
jgi:hypothetical protein